MKRTGIKRWEPERYSPSTEEWAESQDTCWRCKKRGVWPSSLCIHHIVRGTSKQMDNAATFACLCHECHEAEHFCFASIGLWGMLSLKQRYDPANYDLAAVCEARGRAATSITQEEVDKAGESLP